MTLTTLTRVQETAAELARVQSVDAPPMSIPEFAAATRVSIVTVRRHIKSGKIPAYRVGFQWRIPANAVAILLGSEMVAAD